MPANVLCRKIGCFLAEKAWNGPFQPDEQERSVISSCAEGTGTRNTHLSGAMPEDSYSG